MATIRTLKLDTGRYIIEGVTADGAMFDYLVVRDDDRSIYGAGWWVYEGRREIDSQTVTNVETLREARELVARMVDQWAAAGRPAVTVEGDPRGVPASCAVCGGSVSGTAEECDACLDAIRPCPSCHGADALLCQCGRPAVPCPSSTGRRVYGPRSVSVVCCECGAPSTGDADNVGNIPRHDRPRP